jgi:S1-C subfamily serine protease
MSQSEFESALSSILPQIKAATVLIGLPPEQLDDRTPGTGTGFFVIETGLVLTNRHVVEPHLNAKLDQWLRVWLPAQPKPVPYQISDYLLDPHHDLCLLWVDDDGRLPAPLPIARDYQVREGEAVALCGYPYGFTNLFNRGKPGLRGVNSVVQRAIISALWPYPSSRGSEVTLMQLDTLTNPGNSGSPVFLPSTGEVIGVLTGFLQNRSDGRALNTGISEAIPIHYFGDLVQQWNTNRCF